LSYERFMGRLSGCVNGLARAPERGQGIWLAGPSWAGLRLKKKKIFSGWVIIPQCAAIIAGKARSKIKAAGGFRRDHTTRFSVTPRCRADYTGVRRSLAIAFQSGRPRPVSGLEREMSLRRAEAGSRGETKGKREDSVAGWQAGLRGVGFFFCGLRGNVSRSQARRRLQSRI